MKIVPGLVIFLQLLLLTACGSTAPAESELKTIKLIRLDQQTRQAWYVPTRVILSGPGNATAPLRLLLGNELLLQGMLQLHESSDDLAALEKDLKTQFGQDLSLRRDLTCNVLIKAELNGKTVFEHQTMSGNQGLPLMLNLPDTGSASLKIHLQFSPAFATGQAVQKTGSFSYTKTVHNVNGQKEADENAIATAAAIVQPITGSFEVSHDLEL